MIKQRTFYVGDEKITIKSANATYCRNNYGFSVWINGKKYHTNLLTRKEAEDHIFARWVKEHE